MTPPKPRGFNFQQAIAVIRPELIHLYTGAPGRMAWPASLFDDSCEAEDENAKDEDDQDG